MMKKALLLMEQGVPAILFKPERGKPKIEATITLDTFEVANNRVVWVMKDNTGKLIEGRAKDTQKLDLYPDSWIVLVLPIKIHVFANLCPEFLFCIPSSRRILSLRQFNEEFPGVLASP